MRGATAGGPGSGTEWSRSDSRRLNELARKYPSKEHKEIKARCKLIAASLPGRTAKMVARKLRSLQESRVKNREIDAAMRVAAADLSNKELVTFAAIRMHVDSWTESESVRYTHDERAQCDQVDRLTRSIIDTFSAQPEGAATGLRSDEMRAFSEVVGNRWLSTRARTLHKLAELVKRGATLVGKDEVRRFVRVDLYPDRSRSRKISDTDIDTMIAAAGGGTDLSLAATVHVVGSLRVRAVRDGASSGRRRTPARAGRLAAGLRKGADFTTQMHSLLGALGDASTRVPKTSVATRVAALELSSKVDEELRREFTRQLSAAEGRWALAGDTDGDGSEGDGGTVRLGALLALLGALEAKQLIRAQRRTLRKLIAALAKESVADERALPLRELEAFTPAALGRDALMACVGLEGELSVGGEGVTTTLLALRRRLMQLNTRALEARRSPRRAAAAAAAAATAAAAAAGGDAAPAAEVEAERNDDTMMDSAMAAEESTVDPIDALLAAAQVSTDDDDAEGDAEGAAEGAAEGQRIAARLPSSAEKKRGMSAVHDAKAAHEIAQVSASQDCRYISCESFSSFSLT